MPERACTWCRFLRELYTEDMAAQLRAYIDSLPQEIRTDEAEYGRRLALCGACPDCHDGLCRHCGCFVAARATKSALGCPSPTHDRW